MARHARKRYAERFPASPCTPMLQADDRRGTGPPIGRPEHGGGIRGELDVVLQNERGRAVGGEERAEGFLVADGAGHGADVEVPGGTVQVRPAFPVFLLREQFGVDGGDALGRHPDPVQVLPDVRHAVGPAIEVDDVDRKLHDPPVACQPGGCRAVADTEHANV